MVSKTLMLSIKGRVCISQGLDEGLSLKVLLVEIGRMVEIDSEVLEPALRPPIRGGEGLVERANKYAGLFPKLQGEELTGEEW